MATFIQPLVAIEKMKHLISLLIIFSLTACNQDDSFTQVDNDSLLKTDQTKGSWKELSSGLYINSNGDLGFPTESDLVFIPSSQIDDERVMCPNNFLTTFGYEDSLRLRDVIDTNTFQPLGASFYKDKNNIYSHYAVCDAGVFSIFASDTSTFRVVGTYAIYKSKVFHFRNGQIDADAETFQSFTDFSNIAKDKNGYFSFGERISLEDLKKEMGEELFEKLIE